MISKISVFSLFATTRHSTFAGSSPGWKPIPTTLSTRWVCGLVEQTSLNNIYHIEKRTSVHKKTKPFRKTIPSHNNKEEPGELLSNVLEFGI